MRPKLLIVDSDSNWCGASEQFFTDYGFDVDTSSDGIGCFKKIRQRTPDVIVIDTDINWGGADGVIDHLNKEHPQHEIPVILTETTDYPHVATCIDEPPVVARISKPVTLDMLLERIHEALTKKQPCLNQTSTHSELFIG